MKHILDKIEALELALLGETGLKYNIYDKLDELKKRSTELEVELAVIDTFEGKLGDMIARIEALENSQYATKEPIDVEALTPHVGLANYDEPHGTNVEGDGGSWYIDVSTNGGYRNAQLTYGDNRNSTAPVALATPGIRLFARNTVDDPWSYIGTTLNSSGNGNELRIRLTQDVNPKSLQLINPGAQLGFDI